MQLLTVVDARNQFCDLSNNPWVEFCSGFWFCWFLGVGFLCTYVGDVVSSLLKILFFKVRSAPSISIYLPTNYRNIAKNTQYCQFSTYWGNYLKRAPCALFASHIPVSSSFSGRTNHSLSFPLSPLVKRESEREGKREREKERESDGRPAPISQPPFSPGRVMRSPDAGAWCCSPRRAMNL